MFNMNLESCFRYIVERMSHSIFRTIVDEIGEHTGEKENCKNLKNSHKGRMFSEYYTFHRVGNFCFYELCVHFPHCAKIIDQVLWNFSELFSKDILIPKFDWQSCALYICMPHNCTKSCRQQLLVNSVDHSEMCELM